MLLITCPVCGLKADETEFQAGGQAGIRRPMSHQAEAVSDEALGDYLYVRDNPRGPARELWLCARGCGKWFEATRDTLTLEFRSFSRIAAPGPQAPARPRRKPRARPGDGAK
jgi:sarcosine oxidase subunit delta